MDCLHTIEPGSQLELILGTGKIPATVLKHQGNGTGLIALDVDERRRNSYDKIKALYTQPANGSPEATYLFEGKTIVKEGILILHYLNVQKDRRKEPRLELKPQDQLPISVELGDRRKKLEGKLSDLTTDSFAFRVQEDYMSLRRDSRILFNFTIPDFKPPQPIKGEAVIRRLGIQNGYGLRWTHYGAKIKEIGPWPKSALNNFIFYTKVGYGIPENSSLRVDYKLS